MGQLKKLVDEYLANGGRVEYCARGDSGDPTSPLVYCPNAGRLVRRDREPSGNSTRAARQSSYVRTSNQRIAHMRGEGLTAKQIAEALKMPLNTVQARIRRFDL